MQRCRITSILHALNACVESGRLSFYRSMCIRDSSTWTEAAVNTRQEQRLPLRVLLAVKCPWNRLLYFWQKIDENQPLVHLCHVASKIGCICQQLSTEVAPERLGCTDAAFLKSTAEVGVTSETGPRTGWVDRRGWRGRCFNNSAIAGARTSTSITWPSTALLHVLLTSCSGRERLLAVGTVFWDLIFVGVPCFLVTI